MSNKHQEVESDSDYESESEEIEQVAAPSKKSGNKKPIVAIKVEPPIEVPKPELITREKGKNKDGSSDRRKASSISNIAKARAARMAKIAQAKEAAADQYEVEESDEDEELVVSKKAKPKVITKMEADMLLLQHKIDKLELQVKQKRPKKVIQIEVAQKKRAPAAEAEVRQVQKLLDLSY